MLRSQVSLHPAQEPLPELALPPGEEKQTGKDTLPSFALLQGLPSRAEFYRQKSSTTPQEEELMESTDKAGRFLGKSEFKATFSPNILPGTLS